MTRHNAASVSPPPRGEPLDQPAGNRYDTIMSLFRTVGIFLFCLVTVCCGPGMVPGAKIIVTAHTPQGKTIKKAFKPTVRSINLRGLNAKKIDGLSGFSRLEVLTLSDNQLTTVPKLKKLPRLRALHLANNNLRHLNGLNHLSGLEELDLSNNPRLKRAQTIKNGLTGLKNLKLVGMYGIRIPWKTIREIRDLFPKVTFQFTTRWPPRDDS